MRPDSDIKIAIDAAASEFYVNGQYELSGGKESFKFRRADRIL